MSQYIIIVTGPREWKDKGTIYRVLDEELLSFLKEAHEEPHPSDTIDDFPKESVARFVLRHGVSTGADGIANDWGKDRGVTIERFPADWQMPGGGVDYSAGPRRNKEMAAALPRANKCVAFWDGVVTIRRGKPVSGTRDMIMTALQHFIPVRVEPPREP